MQGMLDETDPSNVLHKNHEIRGNMRSHVLHKQKNNKGNLISVGNIDSDADVGNDDSPVSDEDVKTYLADLEKEELIDENSKYIRGIWADFAKKDQKPGRYCSVVLTNHETIMIQ